MFWSQCGVGNLILWALANVTEMCLRLIQAEFLLWWSC